MHTTGTVLNPVHEAADASGTLPAVRPQRLQSLDAYRGLIMLTLLTGGVLHALEHQTRFPWIDVVASQNEHSDWIGCTYWDLIQPSFMFMVGVAMPFAMASRAARGDSWLMRFSHVIIRAINLLVVGWLLDHFLEVKPHVRPEIQIGFIRVLQQIAFGYVFAFFLVGRSFWTQGIAAAVILVGYNLLWMFNPWNGPGGPWARGNQNIGSAFDLWMIHRNYTGYYVGMNAIPATATMIFGVMAGELLHRRKPAGQTMLILLVAGVFGVALGLGVSRWLPMIHPAWSLPIIKRIWTPSFAVFAGGCTTLMLLFFYTIIDVAGIKRWAFPLIVVGMNSIAAYVISGSGKGWFSRLTNVWVNWAWTDGFKQSLWSPWLTVLDGFLFMCFAWGLLYWCYRRKIFFKL